MRATRRLGETPHFKAVLRDSQECGREPRFHAVQIACDLFTLGVVTLEDNGMSGCPLATGSMKGIFHVQNFEKDPDATVESLAVATGREPHEVQTSLCEFNKYVLQWNGAKNIKPRLR